MNIFENKRIIVGISGSIAAYKGLFLVRELAKRKAIIYPIMTPSATHFITPLTLMNLAKNPVAIDMFDLNSQQGGAWHIHYAHSADLMIIAPCSATTIAKIANGICDNSLVTIATALPKSTPLLIAPAMDTTMYQNPATQKNIDILQNFGFKLIPPDYGELASGLQGEGRLPEIPFLLDFIEITLWSKYFEQISESNLHKLEGKKVLISAGPTFEKIDDVRFIGNFSSGKMGYALAKVANYFGAEVTLVSGPTSLITPNVKNFYKVTSSDEMFDVIAKLHKDQEVIIMAAAVADFKPKSKALGKIKKNTMKNNYFLELELSKDILDYLGKKKAKKQILVGFALEETNNGFKNAINKLQKKNCDFLILNYLDKDKSGFESDYNTINILQKGENGKIGNKEFEPSPKIFCALIILNEISKSI